MTTPSTAPGPLPSLIAPQYFAGQLLSDADLDALVGWARARLSLGGRRDGFGVVSGLALRVDPRSGHEADLIVGPGYAVGATGEDIVVVSNESLSLADISLESSDEPTARHLIDVFISAAQVRERPQPGFEYGDTVDEPTSNYSRVSERFKLTAEPATAEGDPERAAARAFEEGYDHCLGPLREFRSWLIEDEPGPERIREWLCNRLLGTEFRFAAHDLSECSHDELREERTAVRALFWLIQHKRNAFLARFAATEDRVRIGRVWLRADNESSARTIVALDGHRPYRRLLSDHSLPAPAGWSNAAEVIWEREAVAHLTLTRRGVRWGEPERLELPHGLGELEGALTGRLMLRPGEQVSLLVYHHAPFGRRVVGVLAEKLKLEVFFDAEDDVVIGETEKPGEADTEIITDEPPVIGAVVVLRGGTEEATIPLTVGTEIFIGHDGADIETDDDADDIELDQYRRHGVLRVEGEVVLVVTSRIGLELNGHRVRGENPLQDGDEIRIGRTEIRIELEE